jgi:two-component system chemotaxis sensor kinase CheA
MTRDDDEEILAAARVGFLDEATEMLRQFEESLLVLETQPGDAEHLNAAFRAAHTIKGTAGLFGFDAVVAFTHDAETLLEALRAGQAAVSEPVIAALLASRDQIESLLDEVRHQRHDPTVAERSAAIGVRLRQFLGGGTAAPATANARAAAASSAAPVLPEGERALWHISLRFGADALRNGLDPLSFVRYLSTLGKVQAIACCEHDVPSLDALDPENCHMGFEIAFESEAERAAIEQVFDFVVDDCDIAILAPKASTSDWWALMQRRAPDGPQAEWLQATWADMGISWPQEPAAASASEEGVGPTATTDASADSAAPGIDRRAAADGDRRTGTRDRRQGNETKYVRVRADKLDHLIDLIGELVIASSGAQLVAREEHSPTCMEAAQRIGALVEDTRASVLSLRMVPIGETFSRFHRVVRDISKQLGKDIELTITGGDTEMDKSMVEVVADPLMHLVRNSLDHGIENAIDRVAAGKPAQGHLALHAYHEAGAITIEVTDDGRGLNRERILAKALERGLVSPEQDLDDEAVYNLIFLPGFSTAEQVTNLSGRGVGMDVVKRSIEALRGQIRIASQPGRGTTIQIRLPLTLAMIDGFLTQVGPVSYVIPLEIVSECIDVPPECTQHPDRLAGYFDLRGEVLPYLDLAQYHRHPAGNTQRRSLIVVRDGHTRIGLVVDRLLGEHQTVIKPLSKMFGQLRAIAGSTILGSGEVALVLDVPALVEGAIKSLHQGAGAHPSRASALPGAPS